MTEPSLPPRAMEARQTSGARQTSPSAARNKAAIATVLAERLPEKARVLEIASGTGEHALACVTARPDLVWTPSDPDPGARASVDDWAREACGAIRPARDIDTRQSGWQAGLDPVDALFCANMIHIAPWQAAEGLFDGAARLLAPTGRIYLYGPFKDGAHTAASNLDFDRSLKARDTRWGVREIGEVDASANENGLTRIERLEMPANNLVLVYAREAGA